MERKDSARVSVVIPAWGKYVGDGLNAAIASARRQGVPVEVLVVDNAHPGGIQGLDATVVRSDQRLSLGAARNLGLESVGTPYVVFWDADDRMLEGTLAHQLAAMERNPRLVACGSLIVDAAAHERHHWPRRWTLILRRWPLAFAVMNAVSSLYPVTGSLLRTDRARAVGFPDVDGGDDWVLGTSLAFRGRVDLVRRPGRLYARDTSSVSATWDARDRRRHANLVRDRLRDDPAVPSAVSRLVPMIAAAQLAVLHVLRPVARLTPKRRRHDV